MSMHLHHPSLSLNGKKKGKTKFRNAEAAQLARELDKGWSDLQKRWGVDTQEKKRTNGLARPEYRSPKLEFRGSELLNKPSSRTGAGIAAKKESFQYTGTAIKGIGTMHKSNAVPIFTDEEAIDISKMRRG